MNCGILSSEKGFRLFIENESKADRLRFLETWKNKTRLELLK